MSGMVQDNKGSGGMVHKNDRINNEGKTSHAIRANLSQNILIYD